MKIENNPDISVTESCAHCGCTVTFRYDVYDLLYNSIEGLLNTGLEDLGWNPFDCLCAKCRSEL